MKMNMGKKIFAAMAMVVSAVCAFGATWTDDDDRTWSFTTNATSATLTGVDPMRGKIAIPEKLAGKPVVAFNATLFKEQPDVTRVVIPSGVTTIPDQAFYNCKNLKGVTFSGNAVTSIGYQAFMGCYNMEAFVIPNSVKTLGKGVFSGCTAMKEVTIGDGIETLTGVDYGSDYNGKYDDSSSYTSLYGSYGNGLFYNCTSLKTINWGKNVKTIGNIAFLGCSALESVTIPDTVETIGNHAFYWCSNLENVKIGNGVTKICRMAFRADGDLINLTMGTNVVEIEQQAFQDCVNLSNFTLPATIRYLRYRCFAGCNKALTEVTIPTNKDNNETELGQGVFSGCSKLATVTLGDTVKTLTGVEYGSDYNGKYDDSSSYTSLYGSYGNGLFYNCTSLKTINWGKGLKTIGNIAFLGCSALESVTIPDTVTSIGNHAFYWCSLLTDVTIGAKVTTIGRMAFRADGNLANLTFGKKVIEIQQQAFQDCVNLKNFTLPGSIQYLRYRCFAGCNKALTAVTIPTNEDELETELGQGVFSGCSKLATVTLGDTVKTLTGVEYGSDYNGKYDDSSSYTSLYGSYANGMFYNCTSLKTINWGKRVETIGNIAFLGCSALESVTIPDTVETIGNHAFYWCGNLKNVTIGAEVTSVGRMAFRADAKLEKVAFGAKVNVINQQAFQDCVQLQNFTLPTTLQYLNYRCFAGCTSMTAVSIPANKSNLETVLSQGVFSGCSKLATVTIGDTVKTLTGVEYGSDYNGKYDDSSSYTSLYGSYANGMFYNCTSLKTINWGAGLKTIGNIAFLNCTALGGVSLPENVTSIGCHAFYGCSSLRDVTVAGTVNSIGRRAFANCANLRYVDFQGAKMAYDAGAGIFDFDRDRVMVFAAEGSTGWKGVADVSGLPESGTWRGAKIAYGPADETLLNPYDFYPYQPTTTVSHKSYTWSAPIMVMTSPYLLGTTVPTGLTEFQQGYPVYLNFAWNEYWKTADAPELAIKFAFSRNGSTVANWNFDTRFLKSWADGCVTNELFAAMQDLEPGTYTIAMEINAGRKLAETDYANNATSVTFTVLQRDRYTVSFDPCGGAVSEDSRLIWAGNALGELPTPAGEEDWTFLGWYTLASGGSKVTAKTVPTANVTYYAHWKKTKYTICFNKYDGTTTSESRKFLYGSTCNLPTVAELGWLRRGMNFKGWAASEADVKTKTIWKGDGASIRNVAAVGETVNVYAVWELADNAYAIQYVRNDGAGTVRTIGFTRDKQLNLNSINGLGWARRGYDFVGWATSTANARAGKVWKTDGAKVTNATGKGKLLTIYAIWKLKSGYYEIRFNKNDGTGKWRALGYECGKSVKLPTCANGLAWSRDGYEFKGWATSTAKATAGTTWKTDGAYVKDATKTGKTLNVYAVWVKVVKMAACVVTPVEDTGDETDSPATGASGAGFVCYATTVNDLSGQAYPAQVKLYASGIAEAIVTTDSGDAVAYGEGALVDGDLQLELDMGGEMLFR